MGEQEKTPQILDLDRLRPPKRAVRICGKEVDVTVIPFSVMLDICDGFERFQALGKGGLRGEDLKAVLTLLRETTKKVCAASPVEGLEADWVDKLDIEQMIELMTFIVRPLFQKVADSKNLIAAGLGGG